MIDRLTNTAIHLADRQTWPRPISQFITFTGHRTRTKCMAHSLTIDVAHDCTIGELLQFMETYNATIFDFEAVGPAGGNPLITFSFENAVDMHLFKATYQTGFCNPVSIVTGPR